jgi:branched-chain amino acid aminotransferase
VLISCKTNLKAFFIAHNYPSANQYKLGISCGLLHAERMNPNAKVFQTEVRKQANRLMETKGFYEVLLVDHEQRITEGSRSNVFFIKGDEIITPPGKQVLLGITRQKTIACANRLNLNVSEAEIHLDALTGFDAAFITGTSPKILPVNEVDGHSFDANNKVLRSLMSEYNKIIQEDLQKSIRSV